MPFFQNHLLLIAGNDAYFLSTNSEGICSFSGTFFQSSFSEDSLSFDFIGTAYFDTKEAKELYREGLISRFQEDYPGAESNFKAALKVEPGNYSLLTGLGNIYAHQNRFDTALEFYGKAVTATDSIYPGVFLSISKVHSARGEFSKALAALAYAAQIGKSEDYILQVMTYYQLTAVEIALKDCAGAELTFNRFDALTKNDVRFNALKKSLSDFLMLCTAINCRKSTWIPKRGSCWLLQKLFFWITATGKEAMGNSDQPVAKQ